MALFSRRVLQKMLDSSHLYFSLAERQNFCNLLNKVHDNYLSAEWELAVLHAASHLGTVQHEPDLSGGRRPDFLFCSESGFSFIADVTAVSDRGLHKQNPFDALQEEFRHQQRRFGLRHGGFSIDVRDWPRRAFRGSRDKPRLKLPKISEFHTKIFGGGFRTFMESVRQNPNVPREYRINSEETVVTFTYQPERRGFGGGSHPAFDFAAVVDSNPVYNALSSKAEQLRNSGYNGIKGIFLCDGGCRILHDKHGHWAAYTIQEVVLHFL